MNGLLAALAVIVTAFALSLPARSQTFTRVTVDGRSMRLLIEGTGDSTVVFENGGGPPLEMWGKVQPQVSRFARTIAYDRFNVGLSDDAPLRDGRQTAIGLREALRGASVPPPYVLVGHSFGGIYVRTFAGLFPDEVSAIVLVDPTHDGDGIQAAVLRRAIDQARLSQLPRVPVVLIDALGTLEVPFSTAATREERAKYRPDVEADALTYKKWLDTIPGARLVTTARSGHNVPIEQPALVVETIREAIEQAKSNTHR